MNMMNALRFVGSLAKHGAILVVRVSCTLMTFALGFFNTSSRKGDLARRDGDSDFHFGVEIRPDFRPESERTMGKNGWL